MFSRPVRKLQEQAKPARICLEQEVPPEHVGIHQTTININFKLIKTVDFNFKLSSHFVSHIKYQIDTYDNVFGHFPTGNVQDISTMFLLFIEAVKVADRLQKTK